MERSASLSAQPEMRAARALAAARAKHDAGAHRSALELLTAAEAGPLGERERADADQLRAKIAFIQGRGADAPALLLRSARRLEPLDEQAAGLAFLEALRSAQFAGSLARGTTVEEAARAVLTTRATAGVGTALDLLSKGYATAIIDGYVPAVPILEDAIRLFGRFHLTAEELRWVSPAAHVAMHLWDDDANDDLSARHIELARSSGHLAVLPNALSTRAIALGVMGDLAAAEELVAEMEILSEATQSRPIAFGRLFVVGWRGREPEMDELLEELTPAALDAGEGAALSFAGYARAVLYNGLGRYHEALAACGPIDALGAEGFVMCTPTLSEVVEAAVRADDPARATQALEQVRSTTMATGTNWGAGIRARCEALVGADAEAEELYRTSITHLEATRVSPQLARSRLVYGEWLRRQGRRVDARTELRSAHELFGTMGMEAFAERARRELLATGDGEEDRHRSSDPAHGTGSPRRPPGGGGVHQPRDRGPALHQRPHRRVAPRQGLHEARPELTARVANRARR